MSPVSPASCANWTRKETCHDQPASQPQPRPGRRSGLVTVEHRAADAIAGPLLSAAPVTGVGYAEPVDITGADGQTRRGQVLEIDGDRVTVQVLDGTEGLGPAGTTIRAHGAPSRLAVGEGLLGMTFDGAGQPSDGGPPGVPQEFRPTA